MRWRDLQDLAGLPLDWMRQPRHIFFTGIDGIGMSGLAFLAQARGHCVRGSNDQDSATCQALRAAGIEVIIGHQATNLQGAHGTAEMLVYGSAIPPENAERQAARRLGVREQHRAHLLAWAVNSARLSLAVTGTHGKSTTSAMAAHILAAAGSNPTALLGAVYPPFGSNYRAGDPEIIVVEADESDGSFTLLRPTIGLVTNLEPEHMENYDHREDELWQAFGDFARQSETLILNADQPDLQRLYRPGVVTYGLESPADYRAFPSPPQVEQPRTGQQEFVLQAREYRGEHLLGVPGSHNLSNALGAVTAACQGGLTPAQAAVPLATYRGIERRFQLRGEARGIQVYDDYGHHPTEVRATLQMAREALQCPVTVVFQPHRYSRTRDMAEEFGGAFAAADRIIITDIYSAFEEVLPGVTGELVYHAVRRALPDHAAWYEAQLAQAAARAVEVTPPGGTIITMGAGTITRLPDDMLRLLAA